MTVLMFHYVRPHKCRKLNFLKKFSIEKFKSFLDQYNKSDFYTRADFLQFKENIPFDKKILLTFDDGLCDHYQYIFPELKARNITAIFFIPTIPFLDKNKLLSVHKLHILYGRLGWENFKNLFLSKLNLTDYEFNLKFKNNNHIKAYPLDENKISIFKYALNYILDETLVDKITDELISEYIDKDIVGNFYITKSNIKEMQNYGMVFGAHGHNHKPFSSFDNSKFKIEISTFTKILKELSIDPFSVSYPFGDISSINDENIDLLKSFNYKIGFMAEKKVYNNDFFRIPRKDCAYLKLS